MQTVPPVIRNYLVQEKYTPITKALMTKYALRIDQGGILEREIMLLLLGIESPDEFSQALVGEAKLSQQVTSGILQDVNTQIFVPLRARMQSGEGKVEQPVKPAAPWTPPPRPPVVPRAAWTRPAPRPVAAAALSTPVPPLLQQPQRPAPLHPVVKAELPSTPPPPVPPRPRGPSLAPLPPKTVLPRGGMTPSAQTDSSRLLEDHEEPHIDIKTAMPKPPPPRIAPPSRPNGPPPNLPGAMPPRGIVSQVMPPAPPAGRIDHPPLPVPPPPRPPAPRPPVQPYSSDPYREPIE